MYHRYLKENSLNIDSIDTLSSIKELADFLEEGRKVDFDKFVSGLKTLEKYIVRMFTKPTCTTFSGFSNWKEI
jgi:hypothetical protein